MAQLEAPTADVADDVTTDSAAAPQTTEQPRDDLADMYGNDTPPVDEPDADESQAGEDLPDDTPDEIEAPHSWKAEEKEFFKTLPREAQEVLSRREADRERFVQSKAQEAAQARQAAHQEALAQVQQVQEAYAQQMQQFAAQFEVRKPDPRLLYEDPEQYAAQLEAYEQRSVQRVQAQRQAYEAQQRAAHAEQQRAALEAQQIQAVLQEKFPEYLDPDQGPKLRQELGSIAIELGYPAEQLAEVNATDILAMRTAREWKAKAAKWDDFQKRKMSTVREAKKLPPLARPGPAGSAANQPQKPLEAEMYPNDYR